MILTFNRVPVKHIQRSLNCQFLFFSLLFKALKTIHKQAIGHHCMLECQIANHKQVRSESSINLKILSKTRIIEIYIEFPRNRKKLKMFYRYQCRFYHFLLTDIIYHSTLNKEKINISFLVKTHHLTAVHAVENIYCLDIIFKYFGFFLLFLIYLFNY